MMCMKEDNPGLNYFKADNSRKVIVIAGRGYPF